MTAGPKRYALRPVRSPQEWAAYHAIRRQAIFAALRPGQAYDETDRHEVAPGNFPHVLLHDGEIIGVVRIDLIGPIRAGLHPVGICSDLQRQGHGRVLHDEGIASLPEFHARGVAVTAAPNRPQSPPLRGH